MIWPYFVGGLLPGLIAAIASYYLTRPLIAAYQCGGARGCWRARRERLARRRAARRPIRPANTGTGSSGP